MKHFLYTVKVVSTPRAATETKRVKLWRVVRSIPTLIGQRDSQYEDEQQALMNLAEQAKALPAAYFVPHPMGGRYFTPARLRELGVATFHRVEGY